MNTTIKHNLHLLLFAALFGAVVIATPNAGANIIKDGSYQVAAGDTLDNILQQHFKGQPMRIARLAKLVPKISKDAFDSKGNLIAGKVLRIPGLRAENGASTDYASDYAGKIIAHSGELFALNPQGQKRSLRRGSSVGTGDTIATKLARAQIRFSDGSLVALRPNTEFKIEEYHFNGAADGSEKGVYNLIKGGLRTLTGVIGKSNRQNYQLKTPVATIGIRGTDFALLSCSEQSCTGLQDGLYLAVADGKISANTGEKYYEFGTQNYYYIDALGSSKTLLQDPGLFGSAKIGTRQINSEDERLNIAATAAPLLVIDGDKDTYNSSLARMHNSSLGSSKPKFDVAFATAGSRFNFTYLAANPAAPASIDAKQELLKINADNSADSNKNYLQLAVSNTAAGKQKMPIKFNTRSMSGDFDTVDASTLKNSAAFGLHWGNMPSLKLELKGTGTIAQPQGKVSWVFATTADNLIADANYLSHKNVAGPASQMEYNLIGNANHFVAHTKDGVSLKTAAHSAATNKPQNMLTISPMHTKINGTSNIKYEAINLILEYKFEVDFINALASNTFELNNFKAVDSPNYGNTAVTTVSGKGKLLLAKPKHKTAPSNSDDVAAALNFNIQGNISDTGGNNHNLDAIGVALFNVK